MSEAATDEGPGRIEWLELFFDLVVVAAVAVLSEGLRGDPSYGGLGIFLVTYGAIWMAWVSVVMYADVAGEQTRIRTVVISMLLLAIMAAAAPGHFSARANAFAGAFLLARVFAARSSLRTGKMMAAWPLLQFGGFSLPWFASFFVDAPWKYWLWAAGLVVDLVMVMVRGEEMAHEQMDQLQRRAERHEAKAAEDPEAVPRPGFGGGQSRDLVGLTEVEVDRQHLDERLGLFVIIVLGEAVAALVLTAAQTPWTRHFVSTSVAAFVLLVGLWLLTFAYGFASAPDVRLGSLPPRFGLPLHLVSTLGILLIGVGLGEAAIAPEPLPALLRTFTCAGLALHFGASAVAGLLGHASRQWLLGWALPGTAYPLVLALGLDLAHVHPANAGLIWLLVLPVVWQYLYAQRNAALAALRTRSA
jgi:low temperature requirement protein LtrA